MFSHKEKPVKITNQLMCVKMAPLLLVWRPVRLNLTSWCHGGHWVNGCKTLYKKESVLYKPFKCLSYCKRQWIILASGLLGLSKWFILSGALWSYQRMSQWFDRERKVKLKTSKQWPVCGFLFRWGMVYILPMNLSFSSGQANSKDRFVMISA